MGMLLANSWWPADACPPTVTWRWRRDGLGWGWDEERHALWIWHVEPSPVHEGRQLCYFGSYSRISYDSLSHDCTPGPFCMWTVLHVEEGL